MSERVSVLGLGVMGRALARALVTAGHDVTVWNRSPGPAKTLGDEGATVADSPGEALAAGGVAVVCLLDYTVTAAVLERAAPELNNRLVVHLTTGSPAEARRLGEWVGAQGGRYVDGAIMSYPSGIGTADTIILYSGPSEVFDAAGPVRAALGGNAVYLGAEVGRANLFDHSLLCFYYGAAWGFLTGAALAEAEGVSAAEVLALVIPLMPVIEETVQSCADFIIRDSYSNDQAPLSVHHRAVEHIVDSAAEAGVDGGLLRALAERMQARIAAGHPRDDLAGLFPVLRCPS